MDRKGNGEQSDPKMEGYLEKKRKSKLVSLWHRYWFVMEGAQLLYYDNRPTSVATSSKGVIKLTSMTSVMAYSPTHRHPEPYTQIANCEIYILTSSKLFTLRTKDVNEHKMWMCALLGQIAALAMEPSREPLLSTCTTLAVPFQSSHINYRHSLTNLTTMEENDNKHLSKCSRTMEYKEFKSGSTGNMLDRQVIISNRETDTETSSEENVSKVQEDGIDATAKGLKYKCHLKESSGSTEMSNEEVIIDERMENFSERSNLTIVNEQKVASLQQQVAKTTQGGIKMEENEILKSKELQSVQIQESKIKSKKFFGRREAKTNSVQMSCPKVYKKSRETVVTDREDADPKLFQALKGDKRSKLEESYSKDETLIKKRITDSRSSNSSTEHKVSHSQVRGNSPTERSEGTKLSNKPKINRVKSKKDSKGCQQPTDTQSYRKSKIAKTGELADDGGTKSKVKKMGFFSKLVKCKKNENSDEKTEVERDPSPEMSRQLNITEDQQQPAEEVSPKKTLYLPRHRTPMGLLVPKDDAEFQKKLLSRKKKIEADQESPVKDTETVTIKKASSMPLHEMDEDADEVMTVNNEEAKPSLPSRAHTPAPPIPERKTNPTQLDSKRNLPPQNFPYIKSISPSKSRLSPKLPEKYQNPGIEMKSNYDIVKFKVKKKETVEKPASTCSQGMNPKVEYSFTSESSRNINTREVRIESGNRGRIEGREEMEIKVSERQSTELNFEENFGMVMPTVTLQEVPSLSSSIRSLNTTEIEEEIMLDADINLGKRGSVDIQTMTFFETSSLNKHSSTEHRSSLTCSTPVPTVTVFSEIPSHPSIYTTTELSDTPSTSFIKKYFSALSASEDRASNKVDELGLLLSELDRINSAPLENIKPEDKPVLMAKEEKRLSSDKDDFLEAFPIRKRRGSDPDYDIPRPHRLPKHHQVSPDKNDFSTDDNERKDDDTTNCITIKATCFLGPGMDQSYNENRYYGFSSDDWNRKSEEMKHYLECKYGGSDFSEEKDPFLQKLKLENEDFEGKEIKENITASRCTEKHFEEKVESAPEIKRESEISVNLRPEKIDRSCRNERSREVYQSDLQDLLKLTETMECLTITSALNEEQATDTAKQENNSLLPMDFLDIVPGPDGWTGDVGLGESNLEEGGSRMETAGVQVEELDSIANANKMTKKTSALANDERLQQEKSVDIQAELPEVILRNPLRSDFSDVRDNKTLRLSFATTETLIVEEEVLVASLKTTTTTTFSTPIEDQPSYEEREEESVEEVVLDMDSIPDDHFGSMKIQSCVQT